MKKTNQVIIGGEDNLISPSLMSEGDFGLVVNGEGEFSKFNGHVVVMPYGRHLVSLNIPTSTWEDPDVGWPGFKVRLLPAGTKITITVGE